MSTHFDNPIDQLTSANLRRAANKNPALAESIDADVQRAADRYERAVLEAQRTGRRDAQHAQAMRGTQLSPDDYPPPDELQLSEHDSNGQA